MAVDQHPDVLLVRKHLVEHLGQPDEVFEISGSPIPNSPVQVLNLAYFAPAGPHAPVVFATCGASQYRMPDGRRVEGLIILKREPPAQGFEGVNRLLGSFALFAEGTGQAVRLGDVVRAPEELRSFCTMDAVLFLPPVPFVPAFHSLQVTRNERVELVWLLPVYAAEAEYALKHGPQALMVVFAAQGLDLTDPERAEANTFITPEDAAEMAKRAAEQAAARGDAQPKPTLLPAGKTKTNRRDMGKGSFDVAEGDTVVVARRAKARSTGDEAPEPTMTTKVQVPSPPTQTEVTTLTPSTPGASNAPAEPRGPRPESKRRPWVEVPEQKNEVRFDLTATAVKVQRKGEAPTKPEKAGAGTKDEQRRQRFQELKAAAKEAEARADARRAGQAAQAAAPTPPPEAPPVRGDSSARAAARRRGAPTAAIEGQLKGRRGRNE